MARKKETKATLYTATLATTSRSKTCSSCPPGNEQVYQADTFKPMKCMGEKKKKDITVPLWEEPLCPASSETRMRTHTHTTILPCSHVLTNLPSWSSRVNYWHFYLFSWAENKKFSAATQAFTKSLLTNWKHLLKHNYSKLSDQFKNTPKTGAKCYLFCLSKPFNLLSLSIFQGLFILTRLHIFPLVFVLMSSKWMPEAYVPHTQFHFLSHCKVDHKHQTWKIKAVWKLTCHTDSHQKSTMLRISLSMNPQSYYEMSYTNTHDNNPFSYNIWHPRTRL